MNIYAPTNKPLSEIGGGYTFHRNLRKALNDRVFFVDRWQDADVILISGVTMVPEGDIREAHKAQKPIIFRVDNVPRMSRNGGRKIHERMRDYAQLATVVVYQSKWAEQYCYPLTGDGTVIYNGVDTELFKPATVKPSDPVYLFAYHGKNEHKGFWHAHYIFQQEFRKNKKARFIFIYNFKKELDELQNANFDFWNGESYEHYPTVSSPQEMAELMRECTHFIYPSIADASPNVVLEARASGLEVIGYAESFLSGTEELLAPNLDISLERMGDEYMGLFEIVTTPLSTV
jgi:glycosyltransferase involved in cell wall biosynthesis